MLPKINSHKRRSENLVKIISFVRPFFEKNVFQVVLIEYIFFPTNLCNEIKLINISN